MKITKSYFFASCFYGAAVLSAVVFISVRQNFLYGSDIETLSELRFSDISRVELRLSESVFNIVEASDLSSFVDAVQDFEKYSSGKRSNWAPFGQIELEPNALLFKLKITPDDLEFVYGYLGRQSADKFSNHGGFRSKTLRIWVSKHLVPSIKPST